MQVSSRGERKEIFPIQRRCVGGRQVPGALACTGLSEAPAGAPAPCGDPVTARALSWPRGSDGLLVPFGTVLQSGCRAAAPEHPRLEWERKQAKFHRVLGVSPSPITSPSSCASRAQDGTRASCCYKPARSPPIQQVVCGTYRAWLGVPGAGRSQPVSTCFPWQGDK